MFVSNFQIIKVFHYETLRVETFLYRWPNFGSLRKLLRTHFSIYEVDKMYAMFKQFIYRRIEYSNLQ